jgi:hypothetical protein
LLLRLLRLLWLLLLLGATFHRTLQQGWAVVV